MTPANTSEEGLQLPDRRLDEIRELMDRFNKRLRLNNPRFMERYLKFELSILVNFSVLGNGKKFIAHLERAHVIGRLDEEGKGGQPGFVGEVNVNNLLHPSRQITTDVNASELRGNRHQFPVFAEVVQLFKDPELVACPSVVRFKCVDGVDGGSGDSLYFSLASGFVFRNVVKNREVEQVVLLTSPAGIRPASSTSGEKELVDNMIQSGSHSTESVACDNSNVVRDTIDMGQVVDGFSRIRIAIGPDFVWSGIPISLNGLLQVDDVLFGPFEF